MCTGIRLRAADGAVVQGRTLEFGVEMRSDIVVVPRGYEYVGTTPSGGQGLRWTTAYGFVGADSQGLPHVCDGLNERGLGIGLFYFPGFAEYADVAAGDSKTALAPWELGTYLLSRCATVAEAAEAVAGVSVGAVPADDSGFVPPLHYRVTDAEGRTIVVEPRGGTLVVHDDPIGVITNSPTFDWHLTNLRNYVNLRPLETAPIDVAGLRIGPLGMGTGMLGLPGDWTPPSRFIRAAAFTLTADQPKTASEAVLEAFHVLNLFDIPRGSVRSSEGSTAPADYTSWTSVSDLTNRRFYMHTYENRRIRFVDLGRCDLSAPAIAKVPMTEPETLEDLTPAAA